MTAPCRCWLCNGPARMKLAAWVTRRPLPEPLRVIHRAFWSKFAEGGTARAR